MVVKLSRLACEVAGDQREQIAGLGEGVLPLGPVAAVRRLRRCATRLPFDSRTGKRVASPSIRTRYLRQHVGPVGEEGDAAEALGLALGAEHAARGVEAHQLGVGRGADLDFGLDRRAVAGNVDDQLLAVHAVRGRRCPSTLTDTQLRARRRRAAAAGHGSPLRSTFSVARTRVRSGAEVEVEPDLRHQPVGRAIILAADRDMGRARAELRARSAASGSVVRTSAMAADLGARVEASQAERRR